MFTHNNLSPALIEKISAGEKIYEDLIQEKIKHKNDHLETTRLREEKQRYKYEQEERQLREQIELTSRYNPHRSPDEIAHSIRSSHDSNVLLFHVFIPGLVCVLIWFVGKLILEQLKIYYLEAIIISCCLIFLIFLWFIPKWKKEEKRLDEQIQSLGFGSREEY